MPPFFVIKVLGFVLALVVPLGNIVADFYGHIAPMNFDGNFHLAFSSRPEFLLGVRSERRGWGAAPGADASTKQQKCTCLKMADRCIGITIAI